MDNTHLEKYTHFSALPWIEKWVKNYPLTLEIKNNRKTKLGDYRKVHGGCKITINSGLNKDLFFMVLTHEIAHMHAFARYGNHIQPHGREWKKIFGHLLQQSIAVYPTELQSIILDFSKNPRANYYSYPPIVNYFNSKDEEPKVTLHSLEKNTIFRIGSKILKKGEKRKIRYICTELNSGKSYLIHGLAPVDKIVTNER